MELRHLRYFVAVAEELNFRKASERLRVAQPALSSQIKDLEHELGVRLLDRDTGGVRMTDAGAAFLEEARAILAHAQKAFIVAREAAKGRRGRLTVGYFAPLLMGFMPESLTVFRQKYPDVEVTLIELPLADQASALQSGEINVGFTLGGGSPLPSGFKDAFVARSPVRAVMSRRHHLARSPRLSLAQLAHEPVFCLQFKKGSVSVHGEIIRRVFVARGWGDVVVHPVIGADAFRTTIESGLGVSFIAEIGSLSRSLDLVFKPLKETGDDLFVELRALWREGEASPLTANFVSVIREVVPRLSADHAKRSKRKTGA